MGSCKVTDCIETLFSSTSSVSRKYWGFQVFQKALKKVDQESMPMLFTKNFMRTWINHLSKKDRHLHKISLQTVRYPTSRFKYSSFPNEYNSGYRGSGLC